MGDPDVSGSYGSFMLRLECHERLSDPFRSEVRLDVYVVD